MSIKFSSIYTTRDGDTLDALVQQYRLSSSLALVEIESNAAVREHLLSDAALPAGLVIHIPPNAADLVRERLYRLREIRPVLLSHFDTMREIAESDLRSALANATTPIDSVEAFEILGELSEFVSESLTSIAANTASLVDIGVGMSATHVATDADRAVAGAAQDPRSGLYWSVTPPVLNQWETMWNGELWRAKWSGVDSGDAWGRASQYKTTIRSIVVQQVDARIRESQSLERQLLAE